MDRDNDMDFVVHCYRDDALEQLRKGKTVGTTVEKFASEFERKCRENNQPFVAWTTWNNLHMWYLYKKEEAA